MCSVADPTSKVGRGQGIGILKTREEEKEGREEGREEGIFARMSQECTCGHS